MKKNIFLLTIFMFLASFTGFAADIGIFGELSQKQEQKEVGKSIAQDEDASSVSHGIFGGLVEKSSLDEGKKIIKKDDPLPPPKLPKNSEGLLKGTLKKGVESVVSDGDVP